jgi:hypothetical protein
VFTARYGLDIYICLDTEALREIRVLMKMFARKKIQCVRTVDKTM